MSQRIKVQITCDRCGELHTTDGEIHETGDDVFVVPSRYPLDWSKVALKLQLVQATRDTTQDLCGPCSKALAQWMQRRAPNGRPLTCTVDGCAGDMTEGVYCEKHA